MMLVSTGVMDMKGITVEDWLLSLLRFLIFNFFFW